VKVPPAAIYFSEEDRAWVLERIDECLSTGALTLGKFGAELESEFARLCGVRHAIAVNSGTSALEIILRAIGVEGREVVVPTNTFYATGGAVIHAGGRPRFADCEPGAFALNPESLRVALRPETAAVILVHIGGLISPYVDEIKAMCDRAGVPLIEDAAHAHGASIAGRPAGSLGLAAAFSFYPTKVMTSAEGGIIVTDDDRIDAEARIYRDQGKEGFTTNRHVRLGYNWRLSEPQAVIGLAQLRRLPEFIDHRNEIAAVYDAGLQGMSDWVAPVRPADGCRSDYYKYVAMLRGVDRPALKKLLREEYEIGLSGEVYDIPCHAQPVFEAYSEGSFPGAEDICARHICLPISAKTTMDEANYVIASLGEALGRLAGSSA